MTLDRKHPSATLAYMAGLVDPEERLASVGCPAGSCTVGSETFGFGLAALMIDSAVPGPVDAIEFFVAAARFDRSGTAMGSAHLTFSPCCESVSPAATAAPPEASLVAAG